jgi:putative ABC transport system permease protein
MMNDFYYAWRIMRRSPTFTAAVSLTVALTIAANTAIFSIVNAVILRPLPYANPNRIIQVAEKKDKANIPNIGASVLNFVSWREQTRDFQSLGAFGGAPYTLTGSGEPEQLVGATVTPSLVRVLGVTPIAGHAFADDDEKPGAPAVAMIGEALWQRRFGSDPGLVGRTIILNNIPTTVVGIAPAALNLLTGGDLYTPLTIDPAKERRLNHQIAVFGRLKTGVTLEQARAEMNTISARMDQQYPELKDWSLTLITLYDTVVSKPLETGLLVLLAAVGLVLLIACANIANLLLSRAATRQGEMAVRTAIGASRDRLVRQLLAESLSLSILGGAIGLAGATGGVWLLNHILPPNVLPVSNVPIDATVLAFSVAITLVTGLLFGLAPAWRLTRSDLTDVLKQTGRGASGGQARLRNTLAAAELALATILLIGAGLLIESLGNLEHVRVGFDSRGLMTFELAPPLGKYPLATKAEPLYRSVLEALRSTPGVRAAGVSSGIPFGAGNYSRHPMFTRGQSVLPQDAEVPIDWRIASPGYFHAMGIPLLKGRDFTDHDGPSSQPVMVVSNATAKKFWGDADPIGRTLYRTADPTQGFTIVGVVGDVRNTALSTESLTLYYSTAWRVWPLMDLVVRTSGAPESIMPAVREKIHQIDPDLALANVKSMDDWLSVSAAQPRLNAVLLGVFAALALIIAAIGIYGVLAYSVNQRRREIGLRIALGAQPDRVLRLVVGEGMRVGAFGIVLGLLGGLGLGRVVSSLVYGVQVYDPSTFVVVAVVLGVVALAACFIPARRAARVDPIVALRTE